MLYQDQIPASSHEGIKTRKVGNPIRLKLTEPSDDSDPTLESPDKRSLDFFDARERAVPTDLYTTFRMHGVDFVSNRGSL